MWKKLLSIYLIFGVSLAILIALSLYAFQRFNAFVKYGDAVDHNHALITELNTLKVALTEAENNQRAFMLFNDSSFYYKYEDYMDNLRTTFGKVHELIGKDSAQHRRLRNLNITIKSQMEYLRSGMLVGYPVTDYRYEKGYMEKSLAMIAEMEKAERALLENQMNTRKFYENRTPQNFRIVFVFTLSIFCISFVLLVQQYRGRIKYQQRLEKNIVELNQANSEWEQIAYVASHDLQEPLRKIRTFSDLLQNKHLTQLDDEGQVLVQKINASSARAQSLMTDIVNYTAVAYTQEPLQQIDLNYILRKVMDDLHAQLDAKRAAVETEELPIVQGYPSQMLLLFRSLMENSIKFSKPDVPLRINLTSTTVKKKQLPFDVHLSTEEYHKIIFQDNGIGFENQYTDKIFKMFQRLHPADSNYEGRGIGLAIVKRIIANHMGFVVARGRTGRGAKFTLYFPLR
jgi:signal transduction histidine kinase